MQRLMIDFLSKRIMSDETTVAITDAYEFKPLFIDGHKVSVVQCYGDRGEVEFEDKTHANLNVDSEFISNELSCYKTLFDTVYAEISSRQKANEAKPEDLVRAERNKLLFQTDYLMLSDFPISESEKEEVIAYRQALRDITEQPGFPWSGVVDSPEVPWPDKPSFLQPEDEITVPEL